ncbi:MAG: hypothetical protein AUJ34_01415 [Parcubacteria group bacterium CG1_02_41_12]|nr:MAG: hypothetical protein AUJ34_01415 [Parcubacteria group bacterium CG1_02_41_12]
MIIGIDGRVLQEGEGGVFVYAKNVLKHLIPLAKKHKIKIFLNQYKKSDSRLIDELSRNQNIRLYKYRFPNKFLNASLKFAKWPNIDYLIGGSDVIFFPSMMYSALSGNTKSVLTMHDVSFEIFPECFTARQRAWHKIMNPKQLCERSNKIIAVSESTRQDVARMYNIDKKKIKTIHSGIDKVFHPIHDSITLKRIKNKYSLPEGKYIIQAGTIEPRKNHIATVEAFSKWALDYTTEVSGWRLLFVGHKGWKTGKLKQAMRRSLFSDRIHIINNASLIDMPVLYSLSQISVYPSLYEGFGFPPLESMACGTPVIASGNSSLGEIVGDAGLLVNPYRIDELVFTIRSLANNDALSKSFSARALSRVSLFDWERCAQNTLKVIESV